jgi:hypothetical protein
LEYFAIDADTKDLKAKIEQYYIDLEQLGQAQRIRMASRYYFNKGKFHLQRTGAKGELTEISVNDFRSLATHTVTLVTGQRVAYDVRATSTDYKSMTQAMIGEQVLEAYQRSHKLDRHLKKAVEYGTAFSEGFIEMGWDTSLGQPYMADEQGRPIMDGDISYNVLHTFQVIRDVYAEDQDWVIIRKRYNKFDLMQKFSEHAEALSVIGDDYNSQRDIDIGTSTNRDATKSDKVTVYLFMHKKSPVLPEGRYVLFCGDVKLIDTVLPYDDIPVYRVAPSNLTGTCLGYTTFFDLLSLQEAIDQLYSAVTSNNLSFATQCLQTEKDSDINVVDLAHGMRLILSDKPITPIQLTKSAPETYQLIQNLQSRMEQISGINQVIRGVPDPNLRSGNALAIISAQAIVYNSSLQQEFQNLFEDIGTATLKFLKLFAKSPRFVGVVGKYKRAYLKEFTGSDLDSIDRVVVDRASPVSQTTAGRVELAQNLLQAGLVKRPEQYLAVLETGRLDPLVEDELADVFLQKAENELLAEGKSPVAIATDNHAQHIANHRGVLSTPDSRMNPIVVQVTLDHIQQHIDLLKNTDPDLLALTGSQPLQPKPQNLPPAPSQATDVNMPEEIDEGTKQAYSTMQNLMNQ